MNVILLLTRNGRTFRADLTPFLFGTRAENEWDESKHPRQKDGKFSETGGDSVGGQRKMIKIEDFLGKEYTGVKGKDAIDKLMKEKQGFVRDAFSRVDIGNVALIWGNKDIGLCHIIKRRKETGQDLATLLKKFPHIIERGELKKSGGQFKIEYDGCRVVISPEFFGMEFQFVLTGYELNK